MHADEVEVNEGVVCDLVADQFPEYSHMQLRVVEPWGTDNAIWRLGDELVVRLPRVHWATAQVDLEERWLPVLSEHLTVGVPDPIAVGQPGRGYPFPWAIHRWLHGEPADPALIDAPLAFAGDVATVVVELRSVPTRDAPSARNRARPVQEYDESTRRVIEAASHMIDADAALAIWEEALAAPPYDGEPVWVHGDLEGNCLLTDGRLTGLVDWGSACAGDPAVDIQIVWSPLFSAAAREHFLRLVDADDAAIARSRGAAVQQACAALPYYQQTYPLIVERSIHKLTTLGVRANRAPTDPAR